MKKWQALIIIALANFSSNLALAADPSKAPLIPRPAPTPGPEPGATSDVIKTYFAQTFIPFFTKGFIQISGILAVIFLIIAGIQFLTAYGNEERLSSAKKSATYSAIGFLVMLLSYAIIAILNTIGITTETPNYE